MAEYIERKKLKSEMTEAMCGTGYQQWAIDVIDRLPAADVVEVVRCKDCELFVNNEKAFVTYCKRECKNLYVKPNDFCSCGKRKEGAEE